MGARVAEDYRTHSHLSLRTVVPITTVTGAPRQTGSTPQLFSARADDSEMQQGDPEIRSDAVTERIIGACIEVHRRLGPGLLESAYEACLSQELTLRGIPFRRQVILPIAYRDVLVDCGYRLDLLVEESVVVELKAVDEISSIHVAQVLTYLKLGRYRVGLLVNFNVASLRLGGIRRVSCKNQTS